MDSINQHDDQSLRDALQGVSAPAGLHQRLLSRLQEEALTYVEASHHADASVAPVELPAEVTGHQRTNLRNRTWVSLALALSMVGLIFGWFQWSQAPSTEQLAQFTLGQLDYLLSEDAEWQTDFASQLADLDVLRGQLRVDFQPLGFQVIAGGAFSKRCQVWKLHSLRTNKSFYVFDFQDAKHLPALHGQLQAINRASGGWSSVAMRSGDRLVVVLVEGALDSYLYQPQSA